MKYYFIYLFFIVYIIIIYSIITLLHCSTHETMWRATFKKKEKIESILYRYRTYIITNNIINDFYADANIKQLIMHMDKFSNLLEELKDHYNDTYIYFKCVYYYCSNEYKKMFILYERTTYKIGGNMNYLIGLYYQDIRNNINYALTYFNKAFIMYSNVNAARILGDYEKCKDNYEAMIEYYSFGIEHGDNRSMVRLAYYYMINKDYPLMKKYYTMAMDLNDSNAAYCLGYHYQYECINYEYMKYYYVKSIDDDDNSYAVNYLKLYCSKIENNEANYNLYVYCPRILTIIICLNRLRKISKLNKTFLPQELYETILTDYFKP